MWVLSNPLRVTLDFFLFFYNVCIGHHYAMCSAALPRKLFINKACCRSTCISLGMNPKPYRQYLCIV